MASERPTRLEVEGIVSRSSGLRPSIKLHEARRLAAGYLALLDEHAKLTTCETCIHHGDTDWSRAYRTICRHPKAIDANKGAYMMTPWPFGCSLHEPQEG